MLKLYLFGSDAVQFINGSLHACSWIDAEAVSFWRVVVVVKVNVVEIEPVVMTMAAIAVGCVDKRGNAVV